MYFQPGSFLQNMLNLNFSKFRRFRRFSLKNVFSAIYKSHLLTLTLLRQKIFVGMLASRKTFEKIKRTHSPNVNFGALSIHPGPLCASVDSGVPAAHRADIQ